MRQRSLCALPFLGVSLLFAVLAALAPRADATGPPCAARALALVACLPAGGTLLGFPLDRWDAADTRRTGPIEDTGRAHQQ